MIQIRLLSDRVHLRRMQWAKRTDSGIHLVERYADDATQYRVLGVGPKVPPEVKPGCYVLIPMMQDSVTLKDETIVARASLIHAVWDTTPASSSV
jgi:co-chaperonin GroES (HSP10)